MRKHTMYSSKEKFEQRKGQEDILILNIYATYKRAPKFLKEALIQLKSYIDSHMIRVEDFDTSLINVQVIQTKTKDRNHDANRHNDPNRLNTELQNISPICKRTHLLQEAWIFLQN